MKNEITIPVHLHDLDEKDKFAAEEHRKKYSAKRDIQALEFNQAIITRLEKDKDKQPLIQIEDDNQVRCERCGKVLKGIAKAKEPLECPDCRKESVVE